MFFVISGFMLAINKIKAIGSIAADWACITKVSSCTLSKEKLFSHNRRVQATAAQLTELK
ncbi:hypothetical protein [Photobacterium leiognathi]|uniref:hypothetical protein n=1 Tax=Photobacterium leiognathi TaxID=553611 RepID=UPI002735903D|nr:hypothetical protein [Photobacterium leiognathi]